MKNENKKHQSMACGLYYYIDKDGIDQILRVWNSDAEHRVEVMFSFCGHKREFFLVEFLKKLGFTQEEMLDLHNKK